MTDEAGHNMFSVEPIREAWTMRHPQLDGYLLIDKQRRPAAAVQVSFNGVVYLPRELPKDEKDTLAAICTALLITNDL